MPGSGWGAGYGPGFGGRGFYPAWGYGPAYSPSDKMNAQDEASMLKEEANSMREELEAISKRIAELESKSA
jgi:Family of unknown function (DUF5320)